MHTALEDRDGVSFWSKGQACLLQYNKNDTSLRSKGLACLLPIIKDSGTLGSGFLSCHTPMRYSCHLALLVLFCGGGAQKTSTKMLTLAISIALHL